MSLPFFQYQILTEPLSVPSVTINQWLPTFPDRLWRTAGVNGETALTALTPTSIVTVDRWHFPSEMPLRRAAPLGEAVYSPLYLSQTVYPDKWLPSIDLPATRRLSPAGQSIYPLQPPGAPSITCDKWLPVLPEPVRSGPRPGGQAVILPLMGSQSVIATGGGGVGKRKRRYVRESYEPENLGQHRKRLRQELEEIYAELFAAGDRPEVKREAARIVAPFTVKATTAKPTTAKEITKEIAKPAAISKRLPPVATVDFDALLRSVAAAEALIALYEEAVEEDAFFLFLAA